MIKDTTNLMRKNNIKDKKVALLSILFFCLTYSLAFAATPTVVSFSPSSSRIETDNYYYTFTTVFSDLDGYNDLNKTYLLINTSISPQGAFYAYYNKLENKLYLYNGSGFTGGYAPGSRNVIDTPYGKLYCAYTYILGSGNNLTVRWRVNFKSSFGGTKNVYLSASDISEASTGWQQKATIIINAPPVAVSVSPSSGTFQTDTAYTVSTVFSDLNGYNDLSRLSLIINAGTNLQDAFYARYNKAENKLYLYKNTAFGWAFYGGYPPGLNIVIDTPYGKLYCADTTVSGSGNDLTINWRISFKSSFAGTKNVYLYAYDTRMAFTPGLQQKGTYNIQTDNTPPTISINSVPSPTNQDVILSYAVTDNQTPSEEIVVTGDSSPYVTEGTHNVTLTARDLAGNNSSASISFTIDKTPPVVIITSPTAGAVVEDSQIQLQGTVDGEAFSETRSLVEGENTLIKTATDSAGNTASASVTVYLYSGQLIGPEGGEAISPDGKVRVVIPQGALAESTRIRILNINNETLQDAAPGNKPLLSAVECKPYGLVFNKPVELIYSLYHAEIPGTPVELGFYDAAQDEIIPTGQTTTVPADGYIVSFSVVHFSTYAALRVLTPQSTPIGVGVKIPLPDMLTGAFSSAIPITIPPGRKGMQPALALHYRSSNTNSWVGQGFSLSPGYIVRSTRLGPPTYIDTQDTFYFITDAGTTELVYLIDNLYQAKVESSFTKFFKEDDSWKAVGKDGSILRLGQTNDAKETSTSGTFAWYITKAVDTNGNNIEYTYIKDNGKSYLSRIDYTGNEMGVSPANYIEFSLESRTDVSSSYISSSKITTAKRLKEIQVKQGYDLVWRYVLEYNYSPDTNRSLLKTITQYGSDNKSLPTQSFSYQGAK